MMISNCSRNPIRAGAPRPQARQATPDTGVCREGRAGALRPQAWQAEARRGATEAVLSIWAKMKGNRA